MAYSGYQGYDPERDRLEQRRNIAQALQQGALETGPKSLPEGIAQIGKALIARQAMKKADKAGDAYSANQKRIADLFVSQMFPGDASAMAYPESPAAPLQDQMPALHDAAQINSAPQSTSGQTSVTPLPQAGLGAMARRETPNAAAWSGYTPQQQQAGSDAAQARAMIAMGVNPMEAASTVQGQQRQRVEDERFASEQKRALEQEALAESWRQKTFNQSGSQFDKTFGLQGDELAEKIRSAKATENLAGQKLTAETTTLGMPDFSDENGFTNQYLGQAKTFQTVRDGQSRIQAVGSARNPAEQMSLIFGYMKMLDPGSTVREGEYATAQNTTGVPGWITNAYNKAKDGVFLNDQQVKDFLDQAGKQYKVAEENYVSTVLTPYRQRAPRYNMDPSIIQDFRLPPEQPKPDMAQQGIRALGDMAKSFGGMFMRPGGAAQGAQPMQPQPMQPDLSHLTDEQLKRIAMGQ